MPRHRSARPGRRAGAPAVLALVAVLLAFAPRVLAVEAADDAAAAWSALVEDYTAWEASSFPGTAMARGDFEDAHRITDERLVAIEARHRDRQRFLERLRAIDRGGLGEDDRISLAILETLLEQAIDEHRFLVHLMPVGGWFGPEQRIPLMHTEGRFRTAADFEDYLARLEQVPQWVSALLDRMRLGMEAGVTPPRLVVEAVPRQIDAALRSGLQGLASPFATVPGTIGVERRAALRERFEQRSKPAVAGALERLRDFVAETYLPACRDSIAASDLPGGDAYYEHQLRVMTTLPLEAAEIHRMGLAEIDRIRREMIEVIERTEFLEQRPELAAADDETVLAAFIEHLRTDPRFYHDSPEELIRGYEAICKRIDGRMPRFFGLLPRTPYGVKEIPGFMAPDKTTAYYSQGNLAAGRPGFFYANTFALDQRPTYEMTALALHEAVPGHHHQIAIAQELEGLPAFRSTAWFTAYGEGWALYCERLGMEMGVYETPYDEFGRLVYEAWRACRLVVDPGIHALGWSRQEAIDFMLANTALSELNIANEVDRYIAWPGQATGYMVGRLFIDDLRARAEAALGADFDLRAFHDCLLDAGAIPLPVLERKVERWIEGGGAPSDADGP